MKLGLSTKFNLLSISLMVLTIFGFGFFVTQQVSEFQHGELFQHGITLANIMSENSEYAVYTKDRDSLAQVIESLDADPSVAYVAVHQQDLSLLMEKAFLCRPPPLAEQQLPTTAKGTYLERWDAPTAMRYVNFIVPILGHPKDDSELPLLDKSTATPSTVLGYVQLGVSLKNLRDRIKSSFYATAAFSLLVALLGILITLLITHRISRPLRSLAGATREIAEGNFDLQVTPAGAREVAELSAAFEVMLRQLRSYRSQVQSYQESLEQKVEERTAALELATARAMELAEKAEAGSRAKSQFLANMSHEIRTPLMGVLGMAELLQQTELKAKQVNYAHTIVRSSRSLLSILNDVLDFSRIEAGKLQLEATPFELPGMIEEVVELFAEETRKKGLELIAQVVPGTPARLVGDVSRTRQILVNLMGNAVKFTHQGEVSLQVHGFAQADGRAGIVFEVRDTGVGIPPDAYSSVFQSFSQADETTTRKFGGTGLGLAICKQICDLMKGTIEFESELGRGTLFRATIPFDRDPAEDASGDARPEVLQGMRVLAAEANATGRHALQTWLTSRGAVPEIVASGEEILNALQRAQAGGHPFEAVILNANLTAMGVVELARAIAAAPHRPRPPLLLLDHPGKTAESEGFPPELFAAQLTKPLRQSQLFEVLIALRQGGDRPLPVPAVESPSPPQRCGHILIVEDNPVNQEVTREMLHMLGCRTQIASNGREALQILQQHEFDLILMDCQMPEIDGYQATALIRRDGAEGKLQGTRRVPVIALTANAMAGDRRKCLAAGMDDYLAKPYSVAQLETILARWLPQVEAEPSPPRSCSVQRTMLDDIRDLALRKPGSGLFGRILEKYLESAQSHIEKLREAIHQQDARTVHFDAHALKGTSGTVGAQSLAELCRRLETMGREGVLEEAPATLALLEVEYENVKRMLLEEIAAGPS